MTSDALVKLRDYYQHSVGYRQHLAAKGPDYFERYVSMIVAVSSPKDRVLDLGCGIGTSTLSMSLRNRRVVGTDLSALFLGMNHTEEAVNDHFVAADAFTLPYGDATFNVVAAMEFIEHIWPVEPVLAEMNRVLTPGGTLVLLSPNLLSPLWVVRDTPQMLFKREFRPPLYGCPREAVTHLVKSTIVSVRKMLQKAPVFLSRMPNLEAADAGGDHDAVYLSHPRDIALFLRRHGFSVRLGVAPASLPRDRLRMRLASVLGSLWTSFLLVAKKGN